jgi:hypothetical protein
VVGAGVEVLAHPVDDRLLATHHQRLLEPVAAAADEVVLDEALRSQLFR